MSQILLVANIASRKCRFTRMSLRANVATCKCPFTQMSLNHFSLLGWLVKWTSGAKSLLTFLTLLSNKTMVRESVSAKASARVEGRTTSAASATTLWLQSYNLFRCNLLTHSFSQARLFPNTWKIRYRYNTISL